MDADDVLAERAAAGDRGAFDELVLRHQARIYRLARILTRGAAHDAEDLAQETFIRAFRAIGRFRHECAFQTWLHRIALNVIWTHLARRRGATDDGTCHDEGVEGEATRLVAADDVETAFIWRQTIDRALATLSADARVAVTLRDIQGLEYREIALVTGVPIGTVESRIFRARRQLRPLLAPLRTLPRPRQDG